MNIWGDFVINNVGDALELTSVASWHPSGSQKDNPRLTVSNI